MGFIISLLLSLAFLVLGVMRPRLAVYLILGAFVLFEELGPGFTTFQGSFIFNASFVGLGLRLIEILTISAYVPILLLNKRPSLVSKRFEAEKVFVLLFALLIAALSALEYGLQSTFTVSNWRLIVTGVMQFHMLILVFHSADDAKQLVKVLLVLLAVKAVMGLALWGAGFGLTTPRGKLPFFWDSRQVEAFGLGVVILTAYLLNYSSIEQKHRFLSVTLAVLIWVVLAAAVVGSIRRTIWVTTMLGALLVLMLSRRTNVLHYFSVVALISVTVATLLLMPGLDRFRGHMGQYVESLNLFSDYQRSKNVENDVHVDNVKQYSQMIADNPDILAFGTYGPSGLNFEKVLIGRYSGEYRLGMAHNAVLRTVLFFGIIGLLLYMAFHIVAFRRALRVYWRAPEEHVLKHVGLACGAVLFLDFAAALFFVPPFWTSSKGLYYTFLEAFIIGIVAYNLGATNTRVQASLGVGAASAGLRRSNDPLPLN